MLLVTGVSFAGVKEKELTSVAKLINLLLNDKKLWNMKTLSQSNKQHDLVTYLWMYAILCV